MVGLIFYPKFIMTANGRRRACPPLLDGFMTEDVYTGCVENMRLPGSNLLFGGGSSSTLSLVITHSLACYSRPLSTFFPLSTFSRESRFTE